MLKKLLFLLALLPAVTLAQSTLSQGGTGWSASTKGDLLVGTSSSIRYTRLPIGSAGNVLLVSNGQPAWVATSSLGFPTGGSGTVTSVSALTPTGLTVSSTTCTTNCILNFTLTSGYVIPLSASTTQWNTFYNASNTLVTFNYASSTFPSFTYGSSTNPSFGYGSSTYYFASNPSGYITSSALSPYVLLSYASSTFPSFGYGSSTYYLATNPSGYITSSALTPYVTLSYGSSTYLPLASSSLFYLASNPSGYVTNSVSNLTNYPTYTYASATYALASQIANFLTYAYASSTYASTSWVTATFVPFSYGSSTYVAVTGNQTIGGNKSFTGTTNLTNWTGSNGTSSVFDVTSVFHLNGAMLVDSNNASGTLGQLLQSTGTSTRWVSTSTLGISGALSGGTTGWLPYWTSASTLSAFSTGTPGQLLWASSTASSGFAWVSTSSLGITGGSGSPSGVDTSLQFNNAGSFGGSDLYYTASSTAETYTIKAKNSTIGNGYGTIIQGSNASDTSFISGAVSLYGGVSTSSITNSKIIAYGDDITGDGIAGSIGISGGNSSIKNVSGGPISITAGNGSYTGSVSPGDFFGAGSVDFSGGSLTVDRGSFSHETGVTSLAISYSQAQEKNIQGANADFLTGNISVYGTSSSFFTDGLYAGYFNFQAGSVQTDDHPGDTTGARFAVKGASSATGTYLFGGNIDFNAGNGFTSNGKYRFGAGPYPDTGGIYSIFNFENLTADRTVYFPNETGTTTLGTGSAGNCAQWSTTNKLTDTGSPCGGGSLSGGQTGYLTRWLSPTTVGTSTLLDDGVNAGVNATSSLYEFYIKGDTVGSHSPFAVASTSGQNIFSVESNDRVVISKGLADSTNATGTLGQVLWSTGTSTLWVSTSSLGIAGAGSITGSGTNGYSTRWTSSSNLASGKIIDDGTSIGVNATSSTVTVNIQANANTSPLTVSSSSGTTLASFAANGSLLIGTSTISATSAPSFGMSLEASNITGALDFIKARTKSLRNFMIGNDHWAATKTWYSPGIANAGLWQNTAGTNAGTAALVLPTVTANSYTALRRTTFASVVTTNNQQVGTRTAAEFFRGSGSTAIPEVNNRIGGFFYYSRFGFTTWTNGNDLFVGLSSCTTACITGTTTLTNLANTIGLGVERGNNNLVFLTNDASGVISTTTLGTTPATNQYFDFYMYQAPNDHTVYYRLDNASTSAIIATGSVSTNLPATTTLMTAQAVMGNGLNTTVGSATLGIQRIYIETEK